MSVVGNRIGELGLCHWEESGLGADKRLVILRQGGGGQGGEEGGGPPPPTGAPPPLQNRILLQSYRHELGSVPSP